MYPDNQNAVPPMSGLVLTMDSTSSLVQGRYVGSLWDPQNLTDLVLQDVLVEPAYFVENNSDLYVPISGAPPQTLISETAYVTLCVWR